MKENLATQTTMQGTMTFGLFEATTLGGRVRMLREYRKLTQTELGKKVGVSQSALAQVESGMTQTIKGNTLLRLAAALEANPRWIMSGKGEPLQLDVPGDASEMLELYEMLDDDHKSAIMAAAKAFANK